MSQPGKAAQKLMEMKFFSPFEKTVTDQKHLIGGVGRALHEVWTMEGIHPAEFAAEALEDANHHKAAEVQRLLADTQDDKVLEEIILTIRQHT